MTQKISNLEKRKKRSLVDRIFSWKVIALLYLILAWILLGGCAMTHVVKSGDESWSYSSVIELIPDQNNEDTQ